MIEAVSRFVGFLLVYLIKAVYCSLVKSVNYLTVKPLGYLPVNPVSSFIVKAPVYFIDNNARSFVMVISQGETKFIVPKVKDLILSSQYVSVIV